MFKYVSLWGAFLAQTPHPTWEMTSLDLRGWSPRHYLPVVYTLFRPRATGTELRTAGEGLAGISGEGPDPPPLDPSETEQPQARFEGPLWMVTAALVKMAVAARCVWCQTIPDWVLVSETWPNLSSPRPRLHLVRWEHGRADLLTGGMGTRGAENSVWHMVTLGSLM